jgi:hypothetical protein
MVRLFFDLKYRKMIMKQRFLATVSLGLSVYGSAVYADVIVQSKEEVEGTWQLQTTKNSLTIGIRSLGKILGYLKMAK